MQVRKWLISGEINYNVCRICSLTLLPPEVLISTPITLSVVKKSQGQHVVIIKQKDSDVKYAELTANR